MQALLSFPLCLGSAAPSRPDTKRDREWGEGDHGGLNEEKEERELRMEINCQVSSHPQCWSSFLGGKGLF